MADLGGGGEVLGGAAVVKGPGVDVQAAALGVGLRELPVKEVLRVVEALAVEGGLGELVREVVGGLGAEVVEAVAGAVGCVRGRLGAVVACGPAEEALGAGLREGLRGRLLGRAAVAMLLLPWSSPAALLGLLLGLLAARGLPGDGVGHRGGHVGRVLVGRDPVVASSHHHPMVGVVVGVVAAMVGVSALPGAVAAGFGGCQGGLGVPDGVVGREAAPEAKGALVEGLAGLREGDHGVLEAAEGALDQAVVLLVVREELVPDGLLGEDLGVPEDDDAVLCAREGDVEAAGVAEEADALVLVGAHAREDDVVLLAALEGVDAGDLDVLVELLAEAAVAEHHVDDVDPLALVGGDDADLGGRDSCAEEPRDDLLDVGGFGAVQVRGPAATDLLVAELDVEEHGLGGHRPREVHGADCALADGDAVLEGALVEGVGGELREARVHAVLDLQRDGSGDGVSWDGRERREAFSIGGLCGGSGGEGAGEDDEERRRKMEEERGGGGKRRKRGGGREGGAGVWRRRGERGGGHSKGRTEGGGEERKGGGKRKRRRRGSLGEKGGKRRRPQEGEDRGGRGKGGVVGVVALSDAVKEWRHLEADGLAAEEDKALKEGLAEALLRRLLAHDDGAQLAVVPDKHELLGAEHHGDQALDLGGLRGLVDQDLPEAEVREAHVPGPDARGADHVGVLEDLALREAPQGVVLLLVGGRELPELVAELHELLELLALGDVEVGHLVVQRQVLHGATPQPRGSWRTGGRPADEPGGRKGRQGEEARPCQEGGRECEVESGGGREGGEKRTGRKQGRVQREQGRGGEGRGGTNVESGRRNRSTRGEGRGGQGRGGREERGEEGKEAGGRGRSSQEGGTSQREGEGYVEPFGTGVEGGGVSRSTLSPAWWIFSAS